MREAFTFAGPPHQPLASLGREYPCTMQFDITLETLPAVFEWA